VEKEANLIGTILKGKYDIKGLLSESTFFEIFSALETETGSSVVVKILREEFSKDSERIKFFSEEVKNFAKVTHPYVAQVYDFDILDGRPFVVTELVEGDEFRAWLKNSQVTFFQAVKVVAQLAELLEFAFTNGVSSRNIKPSNIIRTKEGKIKVLSFSIPRLKIVGGTNQEHISGIQSDLFFLGSTLYEILCKESPIRKRGGINELWDEKLKKGLMVNYPDLEPGQIEKIVGIVDRTFTREVTKRFPDHQFLIKELQELLKIGEKMEKKAPKEKTENTLATASAVVDAIHGRITAEPENIPLEVAPFATAKDAISHIKVGVSTVPAGGGLKQAAALKLQEIISPEEKPVFGRPILQLLKGGREVTRSLIWRCSDEQPLYKNPIILIGGGILSMLLLILFW